MMTNGVFSCVYTIKTKYYFKDSAIRVRPTFAISIYIRLKCDMEFALLSRRQLFYLSRAVFDAIRIHNNTFSTHKRIRVYVCACKYMLGVGALMSARGPCMWVYT